MYALSQQWLQIVPKGFVGHRRSIYQHHIPVTHHITPTHTQSNLKQWPSHNSNPDYNSDNNPNPTLSLGDDYYVV